MDDPVYMLEFGWHSYVIVDDTHGAADSKYRAKTVDAVGFGGADTPQEAILSLCESLRQTADTIEAALVKKERDERT